MIDFLDGYRFRTSSEETKELLKTMVLPENTTLTDHAAWNDWLNSVEKILNQKPRTRPRFELLKPDDIINSNRM